MREARNLVFRLNFDHGKAGIAKALALASKIIDENLKYMQENGKAELK